tara:strand:- start:488 stop:592 length:105 start_codon:yes stop_codon:yes gene_type:complete
VVQLTLPLVVVEVELEQMQLSQEVQVVEQMLLGP